MSKPKPQQAAFVFTQNNEEILVIFRFRGGLHSFVQVMRGETSIRVENIRGEYKPRVTDALRLIEQTANGASPVYRGRQRASRAAKPKSDPWIVASLKLVRGDE
jgi:hypothetical protein